MANLPAPRKQIAEYNYENGQLRSRRAYWGSKKGWVTQSYSTPQEQAIEKGSTANIANLLGQVHNAVNLSPEAIASYGDAYAAPQIQALNDAYHKSRGQLEMAGGGANMRHSVGFTNVLANDLEKNQAQGLADIAANRKMMELDLPNKLLSPYVNQFNLYNAAMTGQQANMAQDREPAFQGSQIGQQSEYPNMLERFRLQTAADAANAANKGSRGGLFSFLTGG